LLISASIYNAFEALPESIEGVLPPLAWALFHQNADALDKHQNLKS
jgi:hypothetical protein